MVNTEVESAEKTFYCSFCGKSQHEVIKLIAGPTVFICDECVDLCNGIIEGGRDGVAMFKFLLALDDETWKGMNITAGTLLTETFGISFEEPPFQGVSVKDMCVRFSKTISRLVYEKLPVVELEDEINSLETELKRLTVLLVPPSDVVERHADVKARLAVARTTRETFNASASVAKSS